MQDFFKEYRKEALSVTRDRFVALHPGAYLLVEVPVEGESHSWGFKTDIRQSGNLPAAEEMMKPAIEQLLKPGRFLVKVVKTDRNSWSGWITVGRARNNDVVLRHRSISKLHARIVVEGAEHRLEDSGSANGTWLNEKKVGPGCTTPLRSGDQIVFGTLSCEFLKVEDLYDRLRKIPATTRYEFDF